MQMKCYLAVKLINGRRFVYEDVAGAEPVANAYFI